MLKFLDGKKTILTAVAMAGTAAGSYYTGEVDAPTAIQRALEALTLIFLRLGIGKK